MKACVERQCKRIKIWKKENGTSTPQVVKRGKRWVWWSRKVQVTNSHLQGGGQGDSRGAEATRSSDLGLMEVVVGGSGRGGRGGCGYQGWGSSWCCWCCCCWGAGSVFSQLSVRIALLRSREVSNTENDKVFSPPKNVKTWLFKPYGWYSFLFYLKYEY